MSIIEKIIDFLSKPNKSMAARIVTAYSALFFITIGILHMTNIYGVPFLGLEGIEKHLEKEHSHKLENLVELNAALIGLWVNERRGDLSVLAKDPGTRRYAEVASMHMQSEIPNHIHNDHDELLHQPGDHTDLHMRLTRFIEHYQGVDSIYLVDAASGKMIIHSESSHDSKFLARYKFLQAALTPGMTESIITMKSPLDGRLSLVFLHQVLSLNAAVDSTVDSADDSESNSPIALAAMFISPERMSQTHLSIGKLGKIGDGVELLLLENSGRLISSLSNFSDNKRFAESVALQPLQSYIQSNLSQKVLAVNEATLKAKDYRDEMVLASFKKIPITRNYAWRLVVKQREQDILAVIEAQESQFVIIGAIGLILVLFLSLLLARYITRPLSELGDAASKIAAGNLESRVEIPNQDEIGRVGQLFNSMAERVQDSQKNLEQQVLERTRQLTRQSQLYATLSQTNQMIVHVKDRQTLFQQACQIAVTYGEFAMVWIGVKDEMGNLTCIASAGEDKGYLCQCPVKLTDQNRLEMQALSYCKLVQLDDIQKQANDVWGQTALKCGFHSVAAIPLAQNGEIMGCITLYSKEARSFDDKQCALVEEMAGDISFALDNLQLESARALAEQKREEREKQLRAVVEGTAGVSGDAFFHSLVEHLANALSMKYAFVGKLLADGKSVETTAVWAQGKAAANFQYQLNATPCAEVLGSSICIFKKAVSDLFPDDTLLSDMGVESYAGVALHNDIGESIGLLVVLDEHEIVDETDVVSMVRIFSQRAQLEMQRILAEKELKLAASVFENTSEAIFLTDSDTHIIAANPAVTHITGYTSDELLNKNPNVFSSGRQSKVFYHDMWQQLISAGTWRGELWNRRKNGEIYLAWSHINAIKNEAGQLTHYLATFLDITEKKKAEEHLEYIANHDVLTGLPNRTLLHDRLRQSIALANRSDRHAAVMFLDLDRFKNINDSLGHDIGDLLLKAVAERLKGLIRDSETIARLGGDDFVIVLSNIQEPEQAAQIAQKVIDRISSPYELGSHELHITPSIGISIFPEDGKEPGSLLKNADTALYAAKDAGRNNYQFYAAAMNVAAFEHLAMENSLRRALEHNEFEVYYQPQIKLSNNQIIGLEALIRWHHPDLGMVSPAQFIPIAEESGLIGQIGDWVLEQACRQTQHWHQLGFDQLRIAVNISGRQFSHGDLYEKVSQVLLETGLRADKLELEITESILMHHKEKNISLLHRLNQMGVELAIDDFGTGYSSLSYLKTFPIQRLKIDQSFVRELLSDPDDESIVMAVIAMAHSMNLAVIAEGAETIEQVEFLRENHCDEVQGYYFSRPIPANEIEVLLYKGINDNELLALESAQE